ncbi:MAG TPA: hypothetical protein VHG10_09325 [Glycomyces sp.]|nr:hypothetical protein [Glycomyces sp.]
MTIETSHHFTHDQRAALVHRAWRHLDEQAAKDDLLDDPDHR